MDRSLTERSRERPIEPGASNYRGSRAASGAIFVLSVFVGLEVISKVSSTLHTPLMSGANAIHGVILIGAILVAGTAQSTPILVLGLIAVILASINMVGGFVVTDRMLIMFSRPRRALEKQGRRELEQ